ncbi:MAG: NusG domain II-containing protein [Gammaproteobacteria bacterium]
MFKLGDKLVLITVILFVGSLYKMFWFSEGRGDFAQVTVEQIRSDHNAQKGKQLLSLSENKIIKIKGKVGISELEIVNGKIRFKSSPCPNQICVHAGWLEKGGEFAACLPNRVALELVANNTFFDAINF